MQDGNVQAQEGNTQDGNVYDRSPLAASQSNVKGVSNGNGRVQASGRVKWFNEAKGFGFIVDDKMQQDHFVHYKEIAPGQDSFKTLKEGDKVNFTSTPSVKGLVARNVHLA